MRRKKMQVGEKVGKSRNTLFFQWFVALEGRKERRRVRSQLVSWEMKIARRCGAKHISKSKCQNTPFSDILRPFLEAQISKQCILLWREAYFQVNMYKTHHSQTFSDHFWKLRFRNSAFCRGAKDISKSTCTKHTILRPLLEVQVSKKCMPLWRESHLQVKMYKTHNFQTTFGSSDVDTVHAVVARSVFPSQKCQRRGVLSLFDVQMPKKSH